MSRSSARRRTLLVLLTALSLASNMALLDWGLPGLWHPDEIVSRSVAMVEKGSLEPKSCADPTWHFYVLIATVVGPVHLVERPQGLSDPDVHEAWVARITPFARGLTALLGTGTVLLTWALGRRLFGDNAGLLAGFVLASSPGFATLAHFATVDIPAVFWLVLATWLASRAHDDGKWSSSAWAGLALGLATATKYPALLATVYLFGPGLLRSWQAAGDVRKNELASIAAGGAGLMLGFAIGNPFALLQPVRFLRSFVELIFYQGTYGGVRELGFVPHIVHLFEIGGPVLFTLEIIGLISLARHAICSRHVPTAALLAMMLVFYVQCGQMRFHPQRYIMTLVPFLALCAGKLVSDLLEGASESSGRRRLATGGMALLVLSSLAYLGVGVARFHFDDRKQARTWILENIPRTATLEVSPNYGVELSREYVNARSLPYFHARETFVRMRSNEHYNLLRSLYQILRGEAPLSAGAPDEREMAPEPEGVGLEGLLVREPEYLILSQRSYERFLWDEADAATHFPYQHELYAALLANRTPYRLVADLRREDRWWLPEVEFVDAGVTIWRRPSGE